MLRYCKLKLKYTTETETFTKQTPFCFPLRQPDVTANTNWLASLFELPVPAKPNRRPHRLCRSRLTSSKKEDQQQPASRAYPIIVVMSDLAPFVAAAIRDKVVQDLHAEVSKLTEEKKDLQQVAQRYKRQYERGNPYRVVSLVKPAAVSSPREDRNYHAAAVAQCRVHLDQALEQGVFPIFEGEVDVLLPFAELLQVQVKIGDVVACQLRQLSFRTKNYFTCVSTEQNFVKIAMEQSSDLKLEAIMGPFSAQEYCELIGIQLHDMQRGLSRPGTCSDSVHDEISRRLDVSRVPADKVAKIYFDDNRMSSDFLFEYLETPYSPEE